MNGRPIDSEDDPGRFDSPEERRAWAIAEHDAGRTYGQIAAALGISRGRVGQIIHDQYVAVGQLYGLGPFRCPTCGKVYRYASGLNSHRRTSCDA